jgi:hypothetical protein
MEEIIHMKLSPEELKSNQLHPDTLEAAIHQVKVNGYVLFESVLPREFVDELRAEYMALFERFMKNPDHTAGENHYRMFLPFQPPFIDERIITSPFVMPILHGVLGERILCHYFASNTCLPGSTYQPVHSDIYPLFPEADMHPPAYHMVLNIPLVDTTEENGPVEIWPGGSHLNTLPRDQIEKLAPTMPSELAVMPAGSIMIRDGRMWHRGTLNRSQAARPNIAIVYTRHWIDRGNRPIGIPQATYDGLSEMAQALFKNENIGGPLDLPQ